MRRPFGRRSLVRICDSGRTTHHGSISTSQFRSLGVVLDFYELLC